MNSAAQPFAERHGILQAVSGVDRRFFKPMVAS
jgi:hypothetical protein